MRNCDIHSELALLGVSAEVHALVDDLGLDLGHVPLWFRQILNHNYQSSKTPLPHFSFKYVYKPHTTHDYIQGKLF